MTFDLDTLLVAVYCLVNDLYRAEYGPAKPRPGPKPRLSDSEVITLMLLAQWRKDRSEAAFVRNVRSSWRRYFPTMLTQSAFNRRVHDLAGVLIRLGPRIHAELAAHIGTRTPCEVLDAVPVAVMRRCRGARHRVFGDDAAVGRGGSDRDWYYGVSLLDAAHPAGTITGFVTGPGNTEGRWLAEALLRWRKTPTAPPPTAEEFRPILGRSTAPGGRRGPTGPLAPRAGVGSPTAAYLGDGGFAGQQWEHHWLTLYGAAVPTTQVAASGSPQDMAALHRLYASHR